MYVKWHDKNSTKRKLNCKGPQGGTLGILEFLSQSNKNVDCLKKIIDENGWTTSPS